MVDAADLAIIEQLGGPALGVLGQAQVVFERDVGLSEPLVVLLPTPVMRVEVLDLTLDQLAVPRVVPDDDVVHDALPGVEVRPVHHEVVVHVELVLTVSPTPSVRVNWYLPLITQTAISSVDPVP